MKIFLIICLASGLASSEKLDRTYLPPPGSKFSGGSPGDIETPLEFPKQSTGPQSGNEKPEVELGINRRPPTGTPDQKPGFNFFQKSYPKITTSYAITQTTTFAPDDETTGIDQPGGFLNRSMIQSGFPGQNQGPYQQYRPGQSQSTVAPNGTKVRPQFSGVFNGPEYLPPVSNKYSPAQVINQDGSRYPSGLPQGPKYQDGQAISVNQPGYLSQQNQYTSNPNISPQYQNVRVPTGSVSQQSQNQFSGSQFPSTSVPKYQDGQRLITPGSNQQNQFTGSQFPSSTVAPQYQGGQRLIAPGSNQQSQFTGSQFPPSTAAPQYQDGQRLIPPGTNQQNQFSSNQDFPSSTATPLFQFGQRFTTPGLNQQVFGAPVPNQQNQFTGNQYQGNQNFPSSTGTPTPGSIEQNQFLRNQNFPSTLAPSYQDGQRFTTPGQNFPTSTSSPQFQDGARLTTPGYVEDGYGSPVSIQQNQNQYPASQYQNGQQFTTPAPIGTQNFPSTAAPTYQGGQRFTTSGQYQGQYGPEQQRFSSRVPGQINQSQSTAAPQYQDSQRFSTPGTQEKFYSPQLNQQNQYPGRQNFPTSTTAPQYQDGQRVLTPGSGQTFGSPQLNPYSTTAPQYQGQPITTPGHLFNQTISPGSTAAPQYQQTLAPTPGINQEGVIPNRQDQFQRPAFSQQFPSSTASPQGFIPGSQSQYGDINILTPGGQIYGNNQQPSSQTGASFASTTVGSLPAIDSTPGFGKIGSRPERPQAEGDRNAEILSYETVLTPEGYFYSYDTSNGIHADETGTVGNGTRAQGGFSYTGDDGKVYSVVYSADENGFQPRGDHLPTPPPIPEAIQRVIDQANKDKESGIDDDGSYNEEKYGYMKYEGPVTRLRSQNKTTPVANGADKQTKKVSKTKGRRPASDSGINEEFESGYESETDKTDMNGDNRRVDDNLDNNKDKNRRITSKRPKPIKNLTVEDNRSDKLKGTRRPVTSEEDEGNTSDKFTEESEDNDDLQESQDFDFDSDLVNYKDDPNNRTDFHGLNKYLPESKKINRKNQSGKKRPAVRVKGMKQSTEVKETEIPEDSELDSVDKSRTRIPSRNYKMSQKVKDMANVAGQTVHDGDDETSSYGEDRTDTDEEFGSDDETKPVYNDRVRKPGTPQSNKKISGKPKRPNVNERTDTSDDKETKPSSYEDKGYEYTAPQKQFGSEETLKFPSRINQKGSQTTLRPFMTKNVYGDDTKGDEYNSEYGAEMPGRGRPITGQKQYPGRNQEGDSYNKNNPEVDGEDGFSITRRPVSYGTSRPFGRPQTTGETYIQNKPQANEDERFSTTRRPISYGTSRPSKTPQTASTLQYQEQGVNGQVYNPTTKQRPGDKLFSNTQGTVSNVFSSTPLPPSGLGYKYPHPGSQNRPDGSYTPDGETYNAATSGLLPSTTYRPNYSFGDKISSPVTVDGFGRPIQSTNAPAFDGTLRPTYSTNKPSDTNQFRPTDGRFGVTSTQGPAEYQPPTIPLQQPSAPIGEDFSGPKQPQTFDPLTGYHYK